MDNSDWRRLNERDWETELEPNVKWTIKYETWFLY
jgi:hypothetical protein